MTDVLERIEAIRERHDELQSKGAIYTEVETQTLVNHDVPWLLSLVDYLREELCLRTCNCGPTDPNPEKHAGYCNYVEALEEIYAALRDAAQEGADNGDA